MYYNIRTISVSLYIGIYGYTDINITSVHTGILRMFTDIRILTRINRKRYAKDHI